MRQPRRWVNKVLSSGHGAEYVRGASPPVPEGRPKPADNNEDLQRRTRPNVIRLLRPRAGAYPTYGPSSVREISLALGIAPVQHLPPSLAY
jgi:hypothetical protein